MAKGDKQQPHLNRAQKRANKNDHARRTAELAKTQRTAELIAKLVAEQQQQREQEAQKHQAIENPIEKLFPIYGNKKLAEKRLTLLWWIFFLVSLLGVNSNGIYTHYSNNPWVEIVPFALNLCALLFLGGILWYIFHKSAWIALPLASICLLILIGTYREAKTSISEHKKEVSDSKEDHFNNTNILPKILPKLDSIDSNVTKGFSNFEEQSKPMDIGEQMSFANALKPFAGMQIELRSIADTKAQKTVEDLNAVLVLAGWNVINRKIISDIGKDGIVIGYNEFFPIRDIPNTLVAPGNPAGKAGHLLLKVLTERGIPSQIIENIPITHRVLVPSNTLIVAVCDRPSPLKARLMLLMAEDMVADDNRAEQAQKLEARMNELQANRYVPNSKSLADAQAEYNALSAQWYKLETTHTNNRSEEMEISDQIEQADFGTNWRMDNIMADSTFRGNFNGINIIGSGGTNPPSILLKRNHINPPPLQ